MFRFCSHWIQHICQNRKFCFCPTCLVFHRLPERFTEIHLCLLNLPWLKTRVEATVHKNSLGSAKTILFRRSFSESCLFTANWFCIWARWPSCFFVRFVFGRWIFRIRVWITLTRAKKKLHVLFFSQNTFQFETVAFQCAYFLANPLSFRPTLLPILKKIPNLPPMLSPLLPYKRRSCSFLGCFLLAFYYHFSCSSASFLRLFFF